MAEPNSDAKGAKSVRALVDYRRSGQPQRALHSPLLEGEAIADMAGSYDGMIPDPVVEVDLIAHIEYWRDS